MDTVERIDQRLSGDAAEPRCDMRYARAHGEKLGSDRDAEISSRLVAGDDRPSHYRLRKMKSAPRRITLHAARIGGGAPARSDARGRGQPSLRPIRPDLDDVAAALELGDGRGRHPVLDNDDAGTRGARPERDGEMLGVPGRSVDRFLQVLAAVHVAQEELRGPLVLLVAAGCAPSEIGLTVAQRERWRERRA